MCGVPPQMLERFLVTTELQKDKTHIVLDSGEVAPVIGVLKMNIAAVFSLGRGPDYRLLRVD